MGVLSNELIAKLKKAQSTEDVAEMLKADGQETTEQEIQQIWAELLNHRQEDEQKLSLDELDSISGGNRDWATEGCCATVEPGSWCGSNDKCVIFDVVYDHMPTRYKCQNCGGWLYSYRQNNTEYWGCRNCHKATQI